LLPLAAARGELRTLEELGEAVKDWSIHTVRKIVGQLVLAGHVRAEGWPRRYRL